MKTGDISVYAIPGSIKTIRNSKSKPLDDDIKMDMIKRIISNYYSNDYWYKVSNQSRRNVEPRQFFCFFAKRYNLGSDRVIGDFIKRDRTTVMHGTQQIKNFIETNKNMLSVMNYLDDLISQTINP